MPALLILFLLSTPAVEAEHSLSQCKAAVARQTDGQISDMDVSSAARTSKGLVIRGRLTLLFGMGPAPAGFARTHHQGRAELNYRCRVWHGRVREAALNPL